MSVRVEQKAAEALRDWLLLQLPAKVAAVNLTRAAVLKAPYAGPYTIPAASSLLVAPVAIGTNVTVALTSGSRTAAQVAAEINTAVGATVATVDSESRLVLTGSVPPSSGVDSVLGLGAATVNSAFGWPEGGQAVVRTALVAPISSGVALSWPVTWPDFGPGFWVLMGDRASAPIGQPHVRRDEYMVRLELAVMRTEPAGSVHRDLEHINAAAQCVREVLFTDRGRQLGAETAGIQGVWEQRAKFPSKAFSLKGQTAPTGLVDVAQLIFDVKVFERPDAS